MAFTGLLSVALASSLHLLTGDVGFDLWDEGFLWYGVKRTAAGEVPLRDFQSYLPGRYYWAAAWSWILGDGILALRLSNNLFRVLGLWLGLLAARRVVPHTGLLLPIGAVLALWMFPQHKPVEASFSLALVYVTVRLVEDPSPRWHFLSGGLVGLAVCFGPNIGLYGALALLFAILLVHERRREGHLARKLAVWCAGVVVGLAPLLGLMAFARGFATSLGESILATGFPYRRHELVPNNSENFQRFVADVRGMRRMGSAAIDLAYVADGRLSGYWELYLSPHDVAAGALLVREAGGVVTDAAGGDDWLRSGHIVAAGPGIHGAILERLEHP